MTRRVAAVFALAAAAALGVGVLAPGERDDLGPLATAADSALRAARVAGARRWAPVNLAQAEDAYRQALVARREQAFRPAPLRSFAAAESAFTVARARATAAASLAEQGRLALRGRATEALREALTALAPLDGVEELVWLGPRLRARLGRARALAREAGALLEAGDAAHCQERAREVESEAHTLVDSVHALAAPYTDADSLAAWREAAAETVAWSRRTGRAALVVYRDEHLLALFEAGVMVSSYRAELGWNNLAHKLLQGDGATPGGRYSIVRKDGPGRSPYHRALLLDYPNAADRKALADAKLQGRVRASARSGGAIEIHGGGGRGRDWTDGCVAVTDAEIDRLFGRVRVGTPVTIVGSRDGRGEFAGLARRLGR